MKDQTPSKVQTASKSANPSNVKNFIANEDLAPFPENEDLVEVMKKISNLIKLSDNWNNNMEAINLLRRVNKHKKSFFNTNFDAHFKYIASNYLSCPRTCIVKISLMLLSEIFSEVISHSKFPDWIEFLIPVVIKKNVLDRNFIGEEARNVLNTFTKNIHCTEGLTIFLKLIQDKNLKYSLRSYELFLDIIEEIDTEKLKTGIKWESILKEIIEISKIKKNPFPNRFKSLFSILLKKLGGDFMEKMLNDMLELEDYLYFSKKEMINFNETSIKLIQEEKGISTKSKIKITLKEHIKSMKHSEKIENDLVLAQEEKEQEKEVEVKLATASKNAKENLIMEKSSKKMPELVLKSSVKTVENDVEKSASGSKVIENENGNVDASTPVVKNENSAKKEIVIAENPLRNFSSVKKNENNNSPAMTGSKNLENINNEERTKGNIEVDPLRSSVAKLKDQENIIN